MTIAKLLDGYKAVGCIPARGFWTAYLLASSALQARYPYLPAAVVRADQERRVRSAVSYAYRYVPYYRETMARLCLTPADFRTAADLAKLPLVERELLSRDPEYFRSRQRPLAELTELRSGGSTGRRISIFYDKRSLLTSAALDFRNRLPVIAAIGRLTGFRELSCTSQESAYQKLVKQTSEWGLLPAFLRLQRRQASLFDPPESTVEHLREFRPHVVRSYGSFIARLFAYLHEKKTGAPLPAAVVYLSDPLPPHARRIIQDEFGIPVFGIYSAVEVLRLAFECEAHAGYHVNCDTSPVRIVDGEGRDVPSGEAGEVVISNLVNRGTVLLNYRLGDLAALLPHACSCRRTLPLMSHVLGRADEYVALPGGRVMHPQAIRIPIVTEVGLWEFQVRQLALDHLEVLIIPVTGEDRTALAARVQSRLSAAVGPGVTISVRCVDAIDRTPAGKHRAILNFCNFTEMGLSTEGGSQ